MKYIVALKDTAAKVFGTPFFVQAPAQAIRSLRDEVNSTESNSDVRKHPADFDLYHVGYFDEDTGMVKSLDLPECIARAKDLREAE